MNRTFLTVISVLVVFFLNITELYAVPSKAEWTVLVYLNGKNNLEPFGLENFEDMAKVGSTDAVNLLVEMGRPAQHYTNRYDAWSGVLRFRVMKDMEPTVGHALENLGSVDMGSQQTLQDFVSWGIKEYPAHRYFVIVWNHGQGYRFQLTDDRDTRARASYDTTVVSEADQDIVGGYRAVSSDDDTGHLLYNSDIQAVLDQTFPNGGLDLLGYDACLMGMVETAYAFRKSSKLMVASEELEPGAGWDYFQFMQLLTQEPQSDAPAVGKMVVDSYQNKYRDRSSTTLSLIDLSYIENFSSNLSALSQYLIDNINTLRPTLQQARQRVKSYGYPDAPLISIDVLYFLANLHAISNDQHIRGQIQQLQDLSNTLVVRNYASKRRQAEYGSNGIAIYFPENKLEMEKDRYRDGYFPANKFKPVEFVQKTEWPNLIHKYFEGQ